MKTSTSTIIVALALVVSLLGLALIGYNGIATHSKSEQTANTPSAEQISQYRNAMKSGAILTSLTAGKSICTALQTTVTECEKIQDLMSGVAINHIDKLDDASIIRLIQEDAKPVNSGNSNVSPSPTPTPKGQTSA